MPLTERQAAAIDAFEWLFQDDEARRTGRSVALAVAAIRHAASHPGEWVPYVDHIPNDSGRGVLRDIISRMIRADPLLSGNSEVQRGRFRFTNYLRPVRNWQPSEVVLGEGGPFEMGEASARLTGRYVPTNPVRTNVEPPAPGYGIPSPRPESAWARLGRDDD